eukprot:m.135651 g.135651  ORF g.135651 m.135651 type:complete len:284 (-) comp10113_c0_seq1:81-932(-)
MTTEQFVGIPKGGFTFDNVARNAMLERSGYKMPRAVKTGTTICGLIFKGGVILGADTRATEGPIVADKNCAKIHYIAPNIYCCGAGTAADTETVTNLIASKLELHRLQTSRESRVVTACRQLKQLLYRYQGHVSAALVLGGFDVNGPVLYSIYPHGSTDKLPFVTMGSGSLAAMGIFESRYRKDMELEEAMQLVRDAIAAGIFNDLGSGSNVDLCIITKEGVDYKRTYDQANKKGVRQNQYSYAKGTTAILSEIIRPIVVSEAVIPTTTTMEEENENEDEDVQ